MSTRFYLQVTILFLLHLAAGFYLPGVAPKEYIDYKDKIKVKVNSLDSVFTQLPFDYYKLPFCRPHNVKRQKENFGEILSGERLENSLYDVTMLQEKTCVPLCLKRYDKKELYKFAKKINEKYRVNLVVDNLPAAQKFRTITTDGKVEKEDYIYEKGYPLGNVATFEGKKYMVLNNHLDIIILYHGDSRYEGRRIVGFEVNAQSIAHSVDNFDEDHLANNILSCDNMPALRIANPAIPSSMDVVWSYSVHFEPSDIKWAMRWDMYLKMQDVKIHWFSIANSFIIVLFLSGMVATILLRALNKDLKRYNASPEELEIQLEETGWKLVHADVFRTPHHSFLFSTFVGTGVQLIAMSFLTLLFAAFGFLSPANRGSLMCVLLMLYVCMSIFNGYYCARFLKLFKQTKWKEATFCTAALFPVMAFSIIFTLNLFVWHEGSSVAIPFGIMFFLFFLWCCISTPLVFLGTYFGFKKETINVPCDTNPLDRLIPAQPWYMKSWFVFGVGGMLPFGAVFIELFFIMSSVWLHHYYYMFGFLFFTFVILLLTAAEITIVLIYFQLCNEDWHWWWRSYCIAGFSAVYLFVYSIIYFQTKLEIVPFVSTLLYFGYMILLSLAFFFVSGTVGFLSTFVFVYYIYGAIKIS